MDILCLSSHLLMNIWIASTFWLLCNAAGNAHGQDFLWTYAFSFPFYFFFRAVPVAYGNSQAGDCIQATTVTYAAAVATQDPLIHCAGPRIEPQPLQQP